MTPDSIDVTAIVVMNMVTSKFLLLYLCEATNGRFLDAPTNASEDRFRLV